jgi:hypothetical protein
VDPQAEGLDLGAEKKGGAGRHGGRIADAGFSGTAKAAGKRDTGKSEVTERTSRTASLRPLKGGEASIEGMAGERHEQDPGGRQHAWQLWINREGT